MKSHIHPGTSRLFIAIEQTEYYNRYYTAPVNSADSGDFTGNFTIPYQDKEYTNQTGFFTVLFLRTLQ